MVLTDLNALSTAILVLIGAILPVVNPIGDAPLFLHLTHGCDDATRMHLARRVAVYSFFLVLGSLVLGTALLRLFGLSVAIIQVAGAAVVCYLGWTMLNDEPMSPEARVDPDASIKALTRAFYPLTMPLTIDPGVMSVAVTIGAHHAHTLDRLAIQLVAAIVGSTIVAVSILLCYRYAERIAQKIGHTGMMVIVRLSAFIVLAIGVQIGWNGIKLALQELGIASTP